MTHYFITNKTNLPQLIIASPTVATAVTQATIKLTAADLTEITLSNVHALLRTRDNTGTLIADADLDARLTAVTTGLIVAGPKPEPAFQALRKTAS